MTRPTMTHESAHAAAMDAGNRHAKANGRKTWTQEDYDAAAAEYLRLWPLEVTLEEILPGFTNTLKGVR